MNPVLQLENVEHQYGAGDAAVRALRGLDLTVKPHEVVLVVGPSGGGKTTALLVMGLLLTPDSGHIRIDGQNVGKLGQHFPSPCHRGILLDPGITKRQSHVLRACQRVEQIVFLK